MDKENVTVPTEPATDENGNVIEQPGDSKDGEKSEKPAEGGNNMLLIAVGVFAPVGGGSFYHFKVYKNQPKTSNQSDYADED